MSVERKATSCFEPEADIPFDPRELATRCIESGSRALLLDAAAIPPEFFDLSTRVAGELLHRLSIYGVRLAAVVPDPSVHSAAFQDFVREANRGRQLRFLRTREEALSWLASRGPGAPGLGGAFHSQ